MNQKFIRRATIATTTAAVVSILLLALADRVASQPAESQRAKDLVNDWPSKPKEVAAAMIQKYGQPQEATSSMLVWHTAGPWKRTILYRDEVPHAFPMPHTDLLEQFIDYRVPPDKFDELAQYDGSVIVERTKGEMSARCDKEEMNFLALNLAHDIVTGKRTVADARQFYARTAMEFMQGKRAPETRGFRFTVTRDGMGDPDQEMKPSKPGK